MAFDVGRDEWARRHYLQLFCPGVLQSGFCQIGRYPLSSVFFRHFSVAQVDSAIELCVINLCDLLSKGSFKAVGSFVAADWVIGHRMIMTLRHSGTPSWAAI